MSQEAHEPNIAPRFSPWKWIAWTTAIVVGLCVAVTAVDRHRMERLRTEVESRGGRLEGNHIFPGWYKWLAAKAPNGWPKQTVFKLKDNFRRVVAVRLPPGAMPPYNLILRLSRFHRLAHLELPDCHLTDADLDGLPKLKDLQDLNLSGNDVTDAGLAHLNELPFLRNVNLRRTRVGDVLLLQASRIPNLRSLNVGQTSITDAGLKALPTLPKMTSLYLGSNQISDIGLASLAPQPSLIDLGFGGSGITDTGLAKIDEVHFPALRYLNIRDTEVTADGVSRLRLSQLELLVFSKVAMTDEHWRELAGWKKLTHVFWGDTSLQREFEYTTTRRRLPLDAFIELGVPGVRRHPSKMIPPTVSP